MEFAGTTYDLTMTNTTSVTGEPAAFLDSQNIIVDPATTLTGNTALIEICVEDEGCYTREFRTVA